MSDDITLHSRFNRIVAVVVWVLSALALGTAVVSADPRFLSLYPAAALLAFFAWSALWRPGVSVGSDGVALRNVSHSVVVPWAALIRVETRYALTLSTPGGSFAAWAAPAPGLIGSLRARRRNGDREFRASGESLRAGDLIGTESGDAALIVREQWRRRLDAGDVAVGVAAETAVHRRWDAPVLATYAVLVTATAWALAVTS